MTSSLGWIIAKLDKNDAIFYWDKTLDEQKGRQVRTDLLDLLMVTVNTPTRVKAEPMSHDFIWSDKEDAIEADKELSGRDGCVVVRVEAFWDEDKGRDLRPDSHGGHWICDHFMPLYYLYVNNGSVVGNV